MAKLTEKERSGFEDIMKTDLHSINQALMSQIKEFWAKARMEVEKIKGFDKLKEQKINLQKQRDELNNQIHQIEQQLNSEELEPEQIVELGGKPDDYGRFKGANFYGIPVTSQFEYDVVSYIKEYIDLEVPVKVIFDLSRSAMRELTMSGTFEEAREAYEKFYKLDFRKYGVDIPPRLEDVRKNIEALDYAGRTLSAGKEVERDVIQYKEGSKLILDSKPQQLPNQTTILPKEDTPNTKKETGK